MKVIKNLVDKSKWNIKCPNAMVAEFIVVHNTANDATAQAEVNYMRNNTNQVSFHYAIDDKEIVQGIEENRNAWHAGDGNGKGNSKGLSIEICYSKSGGKRFEDAERLTVDFIAEKLIEKGWGIDKVTKHQDYSGKYCPHRTLDLGWERFLNMIKVRVNEIKEEKKAEELKKSFEYQVIEKAKKLGLISSNHNPFEKADKWFVLQIVMNAMEQIEILSDKK